MTWRVLAVMFTLGITVVAAIGVYERTWPK